MDEVGGAVQWIDDPDVILVAAFAFAATGFFSPNAVVGVGRQQRVDDDGFGSVIDFGDEIVGLLGGHADCFHVQSGAVDDGASSPSSLDGHVEHGMKIGRHELCS